MISDLLKFLRPKLWPNISILVHFWCVLENNVRSLVVAYGVLLGQVG